MVQGKTIERCLLHHMWVRRSVSDLQGLVLIDVVRRLKVKVSTPASDSNLSCSILLKTNADAMSLSQPIM